MHLNLFQILSLFIIITLIYTPLSFCQHEDYVSCSELFICGNNTLGYPFYGEERHEKCGFPGFGLNCENDVTYITIQSVTYRVLTVNPITETLTVAREDLWSNVCPEHLYNTTLDFNIFNYGNDYQNITLYNDCSVIPGQSLSQLPNQFSCPVNESRSFSFYLTNEAPFADYASTVMCNNSINVPVNSEAFKSLESLSATESNFRSALMVGFGVQWLLDNKNCGECTQSKGRCGSSLNSFVCYCEDQSYPFTCNNTSDSSSKKSLGLGLGIAGAAIAVIGISLLIFFCIRRRKRNAVFSAKRLSRDIKATPSSKSVTSLASSNFTNSIPSFPTSKSDLGRGSSTSKSDLGQGSSYFGVQIFDYTDLQEATDNFASSRELGDGGFGAVFYGKLDDGREVAVKRLYENNFKRVEQFMNEVEILAQIRHKHLVHLYGCTSKRSRELLLVYEYIPNGTVADHLYGKKANSGLLSWPIRLKIAIETADALAHLHKSKCIHRDVKTTNILLDNDFQVKVGDFGLSRLFPMNVTHVSTAPQGTPGYVDPEYYKVYQLTEKSDVYSFGVVLIELISTLQAVDITRHRQEINLANMAINKIQNHELNELVDQSLGFETNSSVKKMVSSVAELAFRCLQQERDMRPSMQEVHEALRGVQNEELSTRKEEFVEIVVDDVALLKGVSDRDPHSPNSPLQMISSSSTSNSNSM